MTFNRIYKHVIINGSDTPIKKQKIARMGKKSKTQLYGSLQKIYYTDTVDSKWMENNARMIKITR